MTSEHFIVEMTAEDLEGKDDEYVHWAGEYKLMQRLQDKLRDCSRATGFIQPAHDEVMQGFVAGLRRGLHATYPAPDAHGSALASVPGRHFFASGDSAGCPAPPPSRWKAAACRRET